MTKKTDVLTQAAEAAAASDSFPVVGRIGVRTDGQPQKSYNLLILSEEAKVNLAKLGDEFGFDPFAKNGMDAWVEITLDAKSRQIVQKAKAAKVVVEGTLTIIDIIAGRVTGSMVVTSARPATLRDGGRIVEVTPEQREERRQRFAERQAARA